jgi:hypothetical protein
MRRDDLVKVPARDGLGGRCERTEKAKSRVERNAKVQSDWEVAEEAEVLSDKREREKEMLERTPCPMRKEPKESFSGRLSQARDMRPWRLRFWHRCSLRAVQKNVERSSSALCCAADCPRRTGSKLKRGTDLLL